MKNWKDIAIKTPQENEKKDIVEQKKDEYHEKLILSSSNYYNECMNFDEHFHLYYGTKVLSILVDFEDFIQKESCLPIFNDSKTSFYEYMKKHTSEAIRVRTKINDFNQKLKKNHYRGYREEDDNDIDIDEKNIVSTTL